jgi:hypothetical protein
MFLCNTVPNNVLIDNKINNKGIILCVYVCKRSEPVMDSLHNVSKKYNYFTSYYLIVTKSLLT